MPIGPYADWDACIADQLARGKTQAQAERICGALERDSGKEKARMAKLKTRDITGVEIFGTGTWNAQTGKVTVTDEDLEEIVANYEALRGQVDIPIKLGHDDDQKLLQEDGYPAAGWVENVRAKGGKLLADFRKVPEKLADLIEAGGYRNVSSEISKSFTIAGKKYGQLLSAVALLGEELPAVTTLADIVALYSGLGVRLDDDSAVQVFVKADDDDADDPTDLLARLEEVRSRTVQATKGKRGAPAFRTWLDESIRRLREIARSKKTEAALGEDEPLEKRRSAIEKALKEQYGGWPYVVETFDDYAITDQGGRYWQAFYTLAADGSVAIGDSSEVERTWRPKTRTTNAGDSGKKEADMADEAVLAALGLPENADDAAVVTAIEALKADKDKFSGTAKTVEELRLKLAQRDAKEAVDAAVKARKVAPAQREWADAYALKDPEGFKAYVDKTPALFEPGERGSDDGGPEPKSEIAQFSAKVAEKLKANPQLTHAEAQRAVSVEEPELFAAIAARR